MVDFYPVSLDVDGRACLVVGAGPVAARKAGTLMACGAVVTVIAPAVSAAMEAVTPPTVLRRPYAAGDAAAYLLVVAATGIPAVDAAVFADADAAGVWVNCADDPAHCSFILPSVHRDGPVTVAVSTSGRSPALATWLRGQLGAVAGPGLGALAELLGRARTQLQAEGRSTESVDWATLLDGPLPGLVAEGRMAEAVPLVEAATGLTLPD